MSDQYQTCKHHDRAEQSCKGHARFIGTEQSEVIYDQPCHYLPEVKYHHISRGAEFRHAQDVQSHYDDCAYSAQPYPRRVFRYLMHGHGQRMLVKYNKCCEAQPGHYKIEPRCDKRGSEKPSGFCIDARLHCGCNAGYYSYYQS